MPRITICVPHWQVIEDVRPCLRSIRKHSRGENIEVIVVDNGSNDASLDYLRSLSWIRLIERPEEKHTNWPANVFTAWDLVLRQVECDYFVGMHSDVFIKADDWLDPFLREIGRGPRVAAVGSWKSASPTTGPTPVTRLNTPGGKPISSMISARMNALTGATSDGLSTTVQPAASA